MPKRTPDAGQPPELVIAYDFDGTLCYGNMQDHALLPMLGYCEPGGSDRFWKESNALAKKEEADRICAYMHLILEKARARKIKLTKSLLKDCGREVKLLPGLTGANNWFERMNRLGDKHGLAVRHCVISSGLTEIIRGTDIAKHFEAQAPSGNTTQSSLLQFERIFASRYLYDPDTDCAIAPAWVINYTTKTQFIFRINKGLLDLGDYDGINTFVPYVERPVPFENIVFIGDGYTDIPCFRLVRHYEGHALAVLPGKNIDQSKDMSHSKKVLQQFAELVNDNRVDAFSLDDHFIADGELQKRLELIMEKLAKKP